MLFQIQQQFVEVNDELSKPFVRPQNNFTATVINCLSTRVSQPRIDLQNMVTTKRKEIVTVENSYFLHNFMSKFSMPLDLRAFLVSLYQLMPPFVPPSTEKVDVKTYNLCYAKIYEASLINQIPLDGSTIDGIQLSQCSIAQVKSSKGDSPCPEVYLNDIDFKNATGYDRDSFYKLQPNQMYAIRENLKRQ